MVKNLPSVQAKWVQSLVRELGSHMLRGIKPTHSKQRSLCTATKTQCRQKKIYFSKNNYGREQKLRNKAMKGQRKK